MALEEIAVVISIFFGIWVAILAFVLDARILKEFPQAVQILAGIALCISLAGFVFSIFSTICQNLDEDNSGD